VRLKRWLARMREPSVLRRLVVAQVVLVLALWLGLIAFAINDAVRDTSVFDSGHRFESIIAVTEALQDQPEQLQRVLQQIDLFQRLENGADDLPQLRMAMTVWRGAELVYASPGEPGAIPSPPGDGMQWVEGQGQRWRALTKQSQRSNVRVTLMLPGSATNVLLTLSSKGLLVLPLLISLPLLVLPAWISVRIALRPWRRVSHEIALRGAGDLSPLQFTPQHRELRPMLSAVNALLKRVQQGLQRERSFIADAAHELRTPLAAMRVHAEALQGRHQDDAQSQAWLQGMLRSEARATRLVGQLLALMRSDAAAQPPQRLALDELLQDRLAALDLLASSKGLELDCEAEAGLHVFGEHEGLASMLDNLTENAIKYGPPGGHLLIRLRREGQEALLEFHDQGPGIPEPWRERVFDRFFRVPDQAQQGSGLGLAIVRSVVQGLGGSIALGDSALLPGPGGTPGLCVRVRLPLG